MDINIVNIKANGHTIDNPEKRFENLLEKKGIEYLKVTPKTSAEEANEFVDKPLFDNEFYSGVPDYLILNKPVFVEVKAYGDGLRESQIEWISENGYEVILAYVETKTDGEYEI